MASLIKKLAGETAVYGISSIIGRFLNWLLVPLYTTIFTQSEYGIVTNLMSYVAILFVLLTYGIETGFFRFANQQKDRQQTYSTGLISLTVTTMLFGLLIVVFLNPLSLFLEIPNHREYIILLAITIGLDVLTALPFAKLRLEKRPVRFATLKLINIFVNLGINLFFLVLCPWLNTHYPELNVTKIWNPNIGIGYIFIAFSTASIINALLLIPEFKQIKLHVDFKLLRKILNYSWPILVVSICGMININLDKMLMPHLIPAEQQPLYQTGIYGANYKLAVIMSLFIQAFRFAFEPFFFTHDSKQTYADVLKYFTAFGLLIFLGVMFYLDLVKLFIGKGFREGVEIVPYVLMANLFFGIFFSLSVWYKKSDKTHFGAIIAIIGAVVTITMNLLLVPRIGYMGAAYAVLICFSIMMILSYIFGQKHYPIPYDIKRIAFYFTTALIIYAIGMQLKFDTVFATILVRTPFILLFIAVFITREGLWKKLKPTR